MIMARAGKGLTVLTNSPGSGVSEDGPYISPGMGDFRHGNCSGATSNLPQDSVEWNVRILIQKSSQEV